MLPRLYTVQPFELFHWHIGPLTLHTYGVLLALAFLTGLWVVSREAKRAGLDATVITDMAVYVLIGGLIGAKVLLLVVEWSYYSKHLGEIWTLLQSGGVFYGGLLGAFPVAWWFARRHRLDGWKTADVLAPGVAIGQAIGRLGCFAAGCCYGRPANVPWAVTFHDVYATRQVGTPLDTPLHPTQLYESLATLAIFIFLKWLAGRKRFDGQVTLAYIFLYAVARFVIEFYRGDAARGMVLGGWMSTSQFIAILMVLAVLFLYPYVLRKQPPAARPVTATS